MHPRIAWMIVILAATAGLARGQEVIDGTSGEEFFERRVRPVLDAHCLGCHGPKAQKAGLRLDSRAALLQGGNGGPALIPGDADNSPLIQAIRGGGDLSMPPTGVLDDADADALALWVRHGAPWPGPAVAADLPPDPKATHWAFQPVKLTVTPPADDPRWSGAMIDRWVHAGLRKNGLEPSPPAEKRTLIRRASFDLIGLPPSPDEMAEFLRDDAPDAFARVVDRLLASPRYGERWARHWLDVARYADTKDYVEDQDLRYRFAYTYRDWVVRALNDDMPYDEFVTRQIAADALIAPGDENSDLAALGFLTLGRRFGDREPDIVDDRIDVITRGTLGLSVACARCHDHKYDPIPTADYYAMYGILAGAEDEEVPLIRGEADREALLAYEAERDLRQRALRTFLEAHRDQQVGPARREVSRYLLAAQSERSGGRRHEGGGLHRAVLDRWRDTLDATASGDRPDPVLGPWHAFAALSPNCFGEEAAPLAQAIAFNRDVLRPVNPLVAKLFDDREPASLAEVAALYEELLLRVDRLWESLVATARAQGFDPPTSLGDDSWEELRQLLRGKTAPCEVPLDRVQEMLDPVARVEAQRLEARFTAWRDAADAPPQALVLQDPEVFPTPHIFRRGDPENPGPKVPRQFLDVLSAAPRKPFAARTGRLELARAIASPANPLTARVMVNRVWMHHFGEGLVRTPSDFGVRGEPPTHPELLDGLADQFVAGGWSLKALHREIMLSQTYQQSSRETAEGKRIDPENRWLGRIDRRRLEFEALRDAALSVSGRIDPASGGPSVSFAEHPESGRRTLYGTVDRMDLPGEYRAFDFADPDLHTPKRHATTVPQQALYLLNAPFLADQARGLATRVDSLAGDDAKGWVTRLYQVSFGRDPDRREVDRALQFLREARGPAALSARERLAQVMLMSAEFSFVD